MLTSCGGGGQVQTAAPIPARLGGSIGLTDCQDWNDVDARVRYDVITALKSFYGGPIVGGREGESAPGPVLDDDKAYDFFQRACKPSYAAAFKLYKLYGRAAGFGALDPDAGDPQR